MGITTFYYSQIENGIKTSSSYALARIIETPEVSSGYILFDRFPDHDALKRLWTDRRMWNRRHPSIC